MKKLLISGGLAFLLLISFTLVTLADTTSVGLTVTDRGVAFSLMQKTASSFFSLNVSDIKPYQPENRPVEAFPLLYLAAESDKAPAEVWKKTRGHGWGRAYKDLGLPANTHGKYMSSKHRRKYSTVTMMDDPSYEEMMVIRFLNDYYDADPEMLFYWHSHGLSYEDLFIGINLSVRIGATPRQFFSLRASGRSWSYIARHYHVSYDLLGQPVQPANHMAIRYYKDRNDGTEREYERPNNFERDYHGDGYQQYRKVKGRKGH